MNFTLKPLFSTLSIIAPKATARFAFKLFQRPLNKKIRTREQVFFRQASHFKIDFYAEPIDCYKIGNKTNHPVLLIHGWESNAGSMSGIAKQLADNGHYVVLINLPGHGFSKLKRTNLKLCREALGTVIDYLNPEKLSIVAHSFGSAVTAYTLSRSQYSVDQIVFLTTPNRISEVFKEFYRMIGLSQTSQQLVDKMASKLLEEPIEKVNIESADLTMDYNQLTIIHDELDKIIPISKARQVHQSWSKSSLYETMGKGHYKMLWDHEVIDLVLKTLNKKGRDIDNVQKKTLMV